MTDAMNDPQTIADGLTALQRLMICTPRPDSMVAIWFRDDRLFERGCDNYMRLTPLGVAVREEIQKKGRV
jgi:hypothetical protein